MNPEPVIQIEDLTYRYGKTVAMDHLSLGVPKGTIFGFLGENGAGKTTTIKILMGLLRPRAGKVCVLGESPLGGNPGLLQKIGYVSDDRAMYPLMRIREILAFNAGLYEQWDREYVNAFIREFELNAKKRIKDLSMGHLALVALVCAMAPRPKLLILDEPCNGLDPLVRRRYLDRLIEARERWGTTVFLSSHRVEEIERITDRIAILCRGRCFLDQEKEALRASLKRLIVDCADRGRREASPPAEWPWALSSQVIGGQVHLVVRNCDEDKERQVKQRYGSTAQVVEMSLEDVFSEYVLWERRTRTGR